MGNGALKPPKVVDGYIGREEIRDFFSQIYSTPSMVLQHASKFHAILVNAVAYGKLNMSVRCKNCGRGISEASCLPRREREYSHRGAKELPMLLVSAKELERMSFREFNMLQRSGGPTEGDYNLLREYL